MLLTEQQRRELASRQGTLILSQPRGCGWVTIHELRTNKKATVFPDGTVEEGDGNV